jgi:3-oxoacyl-[acyl-carrier protein] reductase
MADPFSLKDKTALITGGSGNLGQGITRALAAAGACTAVSCFSDTGRAAALSEELNREGCGNGADRHIAVEADLRCEQDVRRLIRSTADHFGGIDILVSNAGILSVSPQQFLPLGEWRRLFSVNVAGLFLAVREALPHLKASRGVIVNVASINALHPGFGGTAHYDALKGAVAAYTRSLAAELGPEGIRVNAVAPGLIDSQGLRARAPELVSRYEERAPLGRLVQNIEVGETVVFLCSQAASAVTGAVLPVDCGYLLG